MTRLPLTALLLLLPCACLAGPEALLEEREVRGWDVLAEVPTYASEDPDLHEWGVIDKHVRHYSRVRAGQIEMCSVELWNFRDEGRAAAAASGFHYPDWRIERTGASLVMVHGSLRRRGEPSLRGVFPACGHIADRVRDRAG